MFNMVIDGRQHKPQLSYLNSVVENSSKKILSDFEKLEIYRKIYPTFNKRHFMVFVRVFMESFHEFDDHIRTTISKFIEA